VILLHHKNIENIIDNAKSGNVRLVWTESWQANLAVCAKVIQ
jgi:hypothetical protein